MSGHSISHLGFAATGAKRAALRQLWTRLAAMMHARRTRNVLGEMDDRMLADIGIGRGDAQFEASRPMWDLTPPRR